MNFLFNLLVLSVLVAESTASCPVCSCKKGPTAAANLENIVIENDNFEFTYLQTSTVVVNCAVQTNCAFGDDPNAEPATVIIVDGKVVNDPYENSLDAVSCVDSKWLIDGKEVSSIACAAAVFNGIPTDGP